MFVKPAEDPDRPGQKLRVRVPRTHEFLPEEGREVPDTNFDWHRRIIAGDVVLVTPETAEEPQPPVPPGHPHDEGAVN